MALTDDAKAELAAAIKIVREDKFEAFARTTISKHVPIEPPKKDPILDDDPSKDPPKDVDPPPKKDPPTDPPKVPRRSAYWGELIDD